MGKILIAATLATATTVLCACSSDGCSENQTCVPRAGFYSYNDGKQIVVDSIEVGGVGAPNDSLLIKGSSRQTILPLRANIPSTSFFFRYTQKSLADYAITDTLTIDYSTIPYFASEDCGAMFRYSISRISHTHNLIDSVALLDSTVTNLDLELIRIYFRTQTNPDNQ